MIDVIKVGAEPFGCALTPDGRKLYVANQSSNTVSVINTRFDRVTETIDEVGVKPHGIAISADGARVFVTQFLALKSDHDSRPLTQSEGADDGREGRVTVINAHNNHVIGTIPLAPLADVGPAFRSDGNTLEREPLTTVFDNVSGAFPNLLESITIKGDLAYIPGTCSSPNGPFRFNVNVQSCLSTIDIDAKLEAFTTLNMNVGVNFEPVGKRLFNTNPFAVAFKRSAAEGFIALGATNRLLRVTLNDTGAPTINPPLNAADPGHIVRIELKDPGEIGLIDLEDRIGGQNPRGVVLNSTDTRAYVMDFLSRDVAVVDVSGDDPTAYHTVARMQSAALPAPGTEAATVQRGKYLFNSAIGPVGTQPNSVRPSGLLSDTGWGTCYSCHPNGLTDTVTWMFADGPRQAISMESTFEFGAAQIVNGVPVLPDSHQRALNWSAVRDEVQDFTRNVRAVSGGGGLVRIAANGAAVPEGTGGSCATPRLASNRQQRFERRSRCHRHLSGARRARADLSDLQPQPGTADRSGRVRSPGVPELSRREELDDQRAGLHTAAGRGRCRRCAAGSLPVSCRDVRSGALHRRREQRDSRQQRGQRSGAWCARIQRALPDLGVRQRAVSAQRRRRLAR